MNRSCQCLLLACACCCAAAAESAARAQELAPKELAVLSDAVAVARVGAASPAPAADGGALALWIERCLKGRLQAGRDIIWVPRKELPNGEPGPVLWLLFLARNADGSWHVQSGGREGKAIKLDGPNAPIIAEVAEYAGRCGAQPEPEPPCESEIALWIRKAAKGSHHASREAFDRLLAAGDGARPQLVAAASSRESESAAIAHTLLPLTGGGPAVNGLRLRLEPEAVTLKPGERRVLTVQFANLTGREMKVVTGQAAWGDNVLAAAAYEARFLCIGQTCPDHEVCDDCRQRARPPAPTVLPQAYGAAQAGAAKPLPLVRAVPALGTTPLPVEIQLESATVDGKEQLRLKFPHGHIALSETGKYDVRVHFDCPGPRADQQRLLDANYWRGGQLTSNRIILAVKGQGKGEE